MQQHHALLAACLSLGLAAQLAAAPILKLSMNISQRRRSDKRGGADLDSATRLDLTIGLSVNNPANLDAFLRDLYNPASPNFHHYLTPSNFVKKFGPTESDYESVLKFARQNGFVVTRQHPGRMVVEVNAPAIVVEKALRVRLLTYPHPTENRRFISADTNPSIPSYLPIVDIAGLDNFNSPKPLGAVRRSLDEFTGSGAEYDGNGPDGAFIPSDLRGAYEMNSTLNGAGQSVALLEFATFYSFDIRAFEKEEGLPFVPIRTVALAGASNAAGPAVGETELDIEMALGMAPGLSSVIVYQGQLDGSYRAGFDNVLIRMAEDDAAAQISSSWGPPPGNDPLQYQIFQQLAAQGQTFFQAAGDHGAYTNGVEQLADNPFITIVGGTSFSTGDDQVVWNNGVSNLVGGGGISTIYLIPSYQRAVNMTAVGGSTNWRNSPDVAAVADGVYVRFNNGHRAIFEGTSIAAPVWAGFNALVNQQAVSNGLPTVGFLNPALYDIGEGTNYNNCFLDITSGNNATALSPNNFSAAPGYDLCTGWGSPIGQTLIDKLTLNPAQLIVSPSNGFALSALLDGPPPTNETVVSLFNNGIRPLHWALTGLPDWLDASLSNGVIQPNQSAQVLIFLSGVAATPGLYSADVVITNLTGGSSQTLPFSLQFFASGSLQVFLSPPGVVAAGAQWRVDSGPWMASGQTDSGLDVTNLHTISFSNVFGWITPTNQTFAFPSNGVATNLTAYAPAFNFTTLAGSPTVAGGRDGLNANARFNSPNGLAVDSHGNIFVADTGNNVIRELTQQGTNWMVTTIAGAMGTAGFAEGTNETILFNAPLGVVVDSSNAVYVTDSGNNLVRRLVQTGENWVSSSFCRNNGVYFFADGPYSRFVYTPGGIAIDPSNNLYFTDLSYEPDLSVIVPINGNLQCITVLNGNDVQQFASAPGVAFVPGIGGCVADAASNNIETIFPFYNPTIPQAYHIVSVAGSGTPGFSDGDASAARFSTPKGIAADAAGNIYVADTGNNAIRAFSSSSLLSNGISDYQVITISGNSGASGSSDGTNGAAAFNAPAGITVDHNGTIFIADTGNNTVRMASPVLPFLRVVASPGSVALQGAQFSVDNGSWLQLGSSLRLLPGPHTIAYSNVFGWISPANQTLTLETNLTVTAAYVQLLAQLTVNFTATGSIPAGAAWQLDGGAWLTSEATLTDLAYGAHSLVFSNFAGWTAPANQVVFIDNATNVFSFVYWPIESNAPSLEITSPKPSQTWTNVAVTLTGMAQDDTAVASVWFRIAGGQWAQAVGTAQWQSIPVACPAGLVTAEAYAVDTSGNVSKTNSVRFVNAPEALVDVATTGNGTVSADSGAHYFPAGRSLTITAKPSPGFVFYDWTGDIFSSSATITFRALTNISLQANFVPSPFTPAAGIYEGLFFDTNGFDQASSGFFSAQLTTRGSYSASITLDGGKYGFSGQFSAAGFASNYIARVFNPIALQLSLDLSGSNGITGFLTTPNWKSALTAYLAPYSKTYPALQAGQYTLHFSAPTPKSIFPGGDGIGAVAVNSNGVVQFTGTLGDETAVSQTASLSRAGQWPFYASLYHGTGVILGWLTFTNSQDADLVGRCHWIRTSSVASAPYSDGFYFAGEAEGSAYHYQKGNSVLEVPAGYVAFYNGNLSAPFTNQVALGANNILTNQSSNALNLVISTSSGLFHGNVTIPGSHTSLPINGVVLQKQNAGYGLFLNKSRTGRVTLNPVP